MRERLVELLLHARLADHDERRLAAGETLAERRSLPYASRVTRGAAL